MSRGPNFFAGPYLERRAEMRADVRWLEAALADPDTLFLPVLGTAQFVSREPAPHAAFVHAGHALVQTMEVSRLTPLGWFRGTRCVMCEVEEREAALLLSDARFEELRPLTSMLPADEAGLLAYARALAIWRAGHRFCGRCGAPTQAERAGHALRCSNAACAREVFPRIDPAIIVLVTDGERALLGRQASWPAGRYSTIAGFVEPGESLEDAVTREVFEETGVRIASVDYHSSQPWPFPASLMIGFTARAPAGAVACADGELEDARWFTREEIASGLPALPPSTSISYRLIEGWYEADPRG